MKIGITTSVIDRGRTGIAQYVLALSRALSFFNQKHQFVLFVLEEDLPLFSAVREKVQLVTVPERFRPPLMNILWHQLLLPVLARRHAIQVLHVPSYRRMPWLAPCVRVATIHDLAPFHLKAKYDPARIFYSRQIVPLLARRQDHLIAVSENTARDITRFLGINRKHITVVHNGIDHVRFHPGSHSDARAHVVKRYGLLLPFFLYVARLEHPAKNHTRLIAAFNQFKATTRSPWQLVLAGADAHGAVQIHREIERSPCARDIHRLGFVPDDTLSTLYRAASVFLYPSLFEGFGMPPIEAMACGCPVLCSTRGALKEVVGDAAATVEPEDIPALHRQMARLTYDAGLREQLKAAGLAHAKKFDWYKTAAATLEVYSHALAETPTVFAPAGLITQTN